MLLASLNIVFALIFALFARRSLPRGLMFVRSGWQVLEPYAAREDRSSVESRRAISAGAQLVVGGLCWLGAGLAAGGLAVYFALQALQHTAG